MKNKEFNELKKKNLDALKKLNLEKSAELTKAKVDIAITREKNLKKAKNLRKEISQIRTLIREMELAEQNANTKEQKPPASIK